MRTTIPEDTIRELGGRCSRCGSDEYPLTVYRTTGRKSRATWGELHFQFRYQTDKFFADYCLVCEPCIDKRLREIRRAQVAATVERYAAKRAEVIELLGGRCATCGENDPHILRIIGDEPGRQPPWTVYFRQITESVQAGSNEYRLLCSNCKLRGYSGGDHA